MVAFVEFLWLFCHIHCIQGEDLYHLSIATPVYEGVKECGRKWRILTPNCAFHEDCGIFCLLVAFEFVFYSCHLLFPF
jgi:hypothetical protein